MTCRLALALALTALWCSAATQAATAAPLDAGLQRRSRALLHSWPSLGSGHSSSDADAGPAPERSAAGMQRPASEALPGPLEPPAPQQPPPSPPPARGQWVSGSPFASGRGGLYIGIMVAGLVFLVVVLIMHKRGLCVNRRRLGAIDGSGGGQRSARPGGSSTSAPLPPTKHVQLVLIEQPDQSVVYALEYEEEGCKDGVATVQRTSCGGGNGGASARSSDVANSRSAGSAAWAEEANAHQSHGRQPQEHAADGQQQVLATLGSRSSSAAAAGTWGYRASPSPY